MIFLKYYQRGIKAIELILASSFFFVAPPGIVHNQLDLILPD